MMGYNTSLLPTGAGLLASFPLGAPAGRYVASSDLPRPFVLGPDTRPAGKQRCPAPRQLPPLPRLRK
jgi:hypothetical protein